MIRYESHNSGVFVRFLTTHSSIVGLLQYLVLELCQGGDLFEVQGKFPSNRIPEAAARFYTAEIILGVEQIHSLGYVLRDLKPENILVRRHRRRAAVPADRISQPTPVPVRVLVLRSLPFVAKTLAFACASTTLPPHFVAKTLPFACASTGRSLRAPPPGGLRPCRPNRPPQGRRATGRDGRVPPARGAPDDPALQPGGLRCPYSCLVAAL